MLAYLSALFFLVMSLVLGFGTIAIFVESMKAPSGDLGYLAFGGIAFSAMVLTLCMFFHNLIKAIAHSVYDAKSERKKDETSIAY